MARKEAPFTIGFVGRLIEVKGLLVLVRAVAELAHEGDVRLSLAGTGELRPEMERLAAELGIADRLVFHGQVASTEMPALYRSFDVLALPSLTATALEGAVWPRPGRGDALRDPRGCHQLRRTTQRGGRRRPDRARGRRHRAGRRATPAGQQPRRRRRLGQQGRQRALDHYTMAAVARQTHDLYTRVLRG